MHVVASLSRMSTDAGQGVSARKRDAGADEEEEAAPEQHQKRAKTNEDLLIAGGLAHIHASVSIFSVDGYCCSSRPLQQQEPWISNV